MKPRKEIIQIGPKGLVSLPEWVCEALFKKSGSKAKSISGQRKAIKKAFIKALKASINETE